MKKMYARAITCIHLILFLIAATLFINECHQKEVNFESVKWLAAIGIVAFSCMFLSIHIIEEDTPKNDDREKFLKDEEIHRDREI
jgi:predicted tellurium resistance membrane protein TerC